MAFLLQNVTEGYGCSLLNERAYVSGTQPTRSSTDEVYLTFESHPAPPDLEDAKKWVPGIGTWTGAAI